MLGNLLGSLAYALLASIVLTNLWTSAPAGVAAKIVSTAEAKTIGYAAIGAAGFITCFVKAMLCNWMVCLAVVLAMTTTSAVGKVVAAWLPVFVFFAQGFEHLVVNFFVIPAGMMMGAKVTILDWLVWNAIPVTLGNIVGGFLFTGLAIYWTFRPTSERAVARPVAAAAPAE
jgi:formate/nitrite transporter FocA (FNT family)